MVVALVGQGRELKYPVRVLEAGEGSSGSSRAGGWVGSGQLGERGEEIERRLTLTLLVAGVS